MLMFGLKHNVEITRRGHDPGRKPRPEFPGRVDELVVEVFMFFRKKYSAEDDDDYFPKKYWIDLAKKLSNELQILRSNKELGITEHFDCGQQGEYYVDVISLGPLRKEIKCKITDILSSENPSLARMQNLKEEIKKWHDELLSLYP